MENTIGTKLSEARECLELSIEDMSIITRIPSEAIENLETNRFEDFPNSIYAESFLKLYCKFLKIDSKILINELRSSLSNNDYRATYLEGAAVSIEFKNFEEEKSKTASPITLAVAITILMIGIPSIIFLNKYKPTPISDINPELYTPIESSKENIESIADRKVPDINLRDENTDNSSDGLLQDRTEESNEIEPAPKAIPIEKDPIEKQPVAFSTLS
jgi:cytoskeletal protein RodZ